MYPIDVSTCTMDDVVRRSAVCHPTLFTEAMRDLAAIHGQAASSMHDKTARAVAAKMAADLLAMAEDLEADCFGQAFLTLSQRVMAFNLAARLQVLPRHAATAIVAREG